MSLLGRKFGNLTVKNEASLSQKGTSRWLCICDCGNEVAVTEQNLLRSKALSCGCKPKREREFHGMKKTPEWNSWRGMLQRCNNPNHEMFYLYGGKGITVCKEWRKFSNFIRDMGKKPSPRHSIDRKDSNGNYEPGNCRWADPSTQSHNTRRSNTPGIYLTPYNTWQARMKKGHETFHLGTFKTLLDAAAARKSAELKFYGEENV